MRKSTGILGACVVSMGAFAGAAQAADVVIGVPNWPSVNATANVLKVVIEENLGLEVELQNGTNPVVFEAMDKGSMHAHPEVWLPNQQNLHDKFVKSAGTVAMNPNGISAEQGMCVPDFVAKELGVTKIEDLTDPEKAALFDSDGDGRGEIWIGAPGWASTIVERIRAKSYGYAETLELLEIDETLAFANLDAAVKEKKPWIGFCYTPHYIFLVHDLTTLEEPPHDASTWNVVQPTDDPDWLAKSEAGSAWNGANLHLHYSKELEEKHPEVAKLFSNMKLEGEALTEMSYALVIKKEDAAEFAKKWVAANEDTVLSWLQ